MARLNLGHYDDTARIGGANSPGVGPRNQGHQALLAGALAALGIVAVAMVMLVRFL